MFALIMVLMIGVFLSAKIKQAEAGQVVTLTLVSAWTSPDLGNVKLEEFVSRINKEAKIVRIDYKGGAEVVPPLEGIKYVSKGMIDLWHTTPAYYAGKIPSAMAAYNVVASPGALRKSGFWDLFDKIHREKAGVTALGQLWRGDPFGLFLKKPINRADLRGLKIRSLPMYEPFLRQLGASTVVLPMGEVYTALQRGIVDGFCYPYGPGFIEKKWYEVVHYVVHPVIPYQTCAPLLANAKRWDALPQEAKKEIMNIILEMEPQVYEWYRTEAVKSIKKAIKKGLIKPIELPPKEAQKFVKVAKEAMWANIIKRSPEYGPQLKKLAIRAEKLEIKQTK